MAKILQGKVISNKMKNTAVVEVSSRTPHPLYKKLLKRSKTYKVDTRDQKVEVGQTIKIIETRPISKYKHFAIHIDEKESTGRTKKTNTKKEVKK